MEFFLWFWLLDRRFLCEMRPMLKYFSFLWLFPIILHVIMILSNVYCLFPFKNMNTSQNIITFITILEMISIICIFLLMVNLYNISKNQFKQSRKVHVLNFEQINSIDNKNNFIYYEDYWMGRKNLFNANGIFILFLSLIHICWSFYYLSHKNKFQEIFKLREQIVISYAYFNILSFFPVIFLLLCAGIIKIPFILSSIFCTSVVVSLSKIFCKKNKGLNKTIDFSDVPKLEPEFV